MASSPAKSLFDALDSWARLEQLVNTGEAESLYLECKSPQSPQLTRELQAKLATSLSGFANSSGGVVLWGVGTTKHQSGLDVLSHLSPIANARLFRQQVETTAPRLVQPSPAQMHLRTIHPDATATHGVVAAYVARTPGDPVQSLIDSKFHLRVGDGFVEMPYEVIRRMFVGAPGPLLAPLLNERSLTISADGAWKLRLVLVNLSTAIAEHAVGFLEILNPDAFDSFSADGLEDLSELNPGKRVFQRAALNDVVHRGLNLHFGSVTLTPKEGANPTLELQIRLFANRMTARVWKVLVRSQDNALVAEVQSEADLY